jgi:hypothetical protein
VRVGDPDLCGFRGPDLTVRFRPGAGSIRLASSGDLADFAFLAEPARVYIDLPGARGAAAPGDGPEISLTLELSDGVAEALNSVLAATRRPQPKPHPAATWLRWLGGD